MYLIALICISLILISSSLTHCFHSAPGPPMRLLILTPPISNQSHWRRIRRKVLIVVYNFKKTVIMTTLCRPKRKFPQHIIYYSESFIQERKNEIKNVLRHRNLKAPRHAGHYPSQVPRAEGPTGVSRAPSRTSVEGSSVEGQAKAGVPFRVPPYFKPQFSAASWGGLGSWRRPDQVSVHLCWHPLVGACAIGLGRLSYRPLLEVTVAPSRFQPLGPGHTGLDGVSGPSQLWEHLRARCKHGAAAHRHHSSVPQRSGPFRRTGGSEQGSCPWPRPRPVLGSVPVAWWALDTASSKTGLPKLLDGFP